MKVKKFDILPVTIEAEFEPPCIGDVFAFFARLILMRLRKFSLTMNNVTMCSFYRLIVPRFVKGGEADAE